MPYLLGYSRFLSRKSAQNKPFSLELLSNSTFGVVDGSVYSEQVGQMSIKDPTIKKYQHVNDIIDALNKEKIDFALLDNDVSLYWNLHSSGKLVTIGPKIRYGMGFGIAVDPTKPELVNELNKAIDIYQRSAEYIQNYQAHLEPFK